MAKISKKMMLLKSLVLSFTFLRVAFGLPQDCGCPRGPPRIPLHLHPDNTRYYQQDGSYLTQPSRNILSSSRSTDSFLQGLSRYISGHHGFVSSSNPLRKIREVKLDIPSLPHDVNLQDDSVVPVRVIRQSEDDQKKLPEVQQNTSVPQDGKSGQDLKNNNEKNQKTAKRISGPLVPSPRVKVSREQKMVADSLLEHEITPVSTKSAGPDFELDEVIPDPSVSEETTRRLAESSFPQMTRQYADVYKEPGDKLEVYYYPVKRYAEYLQTPQNQIVLIPQGIRPLQVVRPPITYEDLINFQNFGAYDADYMLDDYVNDSKVVDQIEKPATGEKAQDQVAGGKPEEKSQSELKEQGSEVKTANKEERASMIEAENSTLTTPKL